MTKLEVIQNVIAEFNTRMQSAKITYPELIVELQWKYDPETGLRLLDLKRLSETIFEAANANDAAIAKAAGLAVDSIRLQQDPGIAVDGITP
jgi:hypothetical protein